MTVPTCTNASIYTTTGQELLIHLENLALSKDRFCRSLWKSNGKKLSNFYFDCKLYIYDIHIVSEVTKVLWMVGEICWSQMIEGKLHTQKIMVTW